MLKSQKFKKFIILILGVVLGGAIALGTYYYVKNNNIVIAEVIDSTSIYDTFEEKLEFQATVDENLSAISLSGNYSIESPYIELDPYDESPLTAVIIFETSEATQVKIGIAGKDEYTSIYYTFSELTTSHVIPVYGLYADTKNAVTVEVLDEAGEVIASNMLEIQTDVLPDDLLDLKIITTSFDDEAYMEGFNFVFESRRYAFDKNGDIRWYMTNTDLSNAVEYDYENDHFIYYTGAYYQGDTIIFETDKLGKIYAYYTNDGGVHHEITALPNGNILVASSNPDTPETNQDYLYEIDCETGEIVTEIDLKDVLQRMRLSIKPRTVEIVGEADWCHLNSIAYDESDNTLIISSNFQSCIAKITFEGEIVWLMSETDGWYARFDDYFLTPIGEDFEWTYNQHDVTLLDDIDNDPNTTDILVFDNGSSRFSRDDELQAEILAGETAEPELYSRLVHYRIYEDTMEVEQIWEYGKERGFELFSITRGGVELVENGNIIGTFTNDRLLGTDGAIVSAPTVTEVNLDKEVIWEAEIFSLTGDGSTYLYRSERRMFYNEDSMELDLTTYLG